MRTHHPQRIHWPPILRLHLLFPFLLFTAVLRNKWNFCETEIGSWLFWDPQESESTLHEFKSIFSNETVKNLAELPNFNILAHYTENKGLIFIYTESLYIKFDSSVYRHTYVYIYKCMCNNWNFILASSSMHNILSEQHCNAS